MGPHSHDRIEWVARKVLSVADCLVMISHRELFAVVIIEAMTPAVPIVGFSRGGASDVLGHIV